MTHSKIKYYGPLTARILLSLLFIVSALGILANLSGTAGYFAAIGIPLAMLVAILVVVWQIAAALMVATGVHAKEGAWALIAFTILATLVAYTGEGQLIPALTNLSIIGGLLMVIIYGTGPLSLAKKCPCPKCKVSHDKNMGAAGGVCNCGSCDACRIARGNSSE
ncbi:MAG: DoxX family protein [Candidatus Pacebacteria bacterium]|nr:DoxX family protein [Candidatus Paceibacterota bacterium]